MDAIALLKADHRKVEGLFADYEKARNAERKRTLAGQICLELTVHSKIEEDVFYPACRENAVDEDMMNEANVEHDSAKVLMPKSRRAARTTTTTMQTATPPIGSRPVPITIPWATLLFCGKGTQA